MSEFGTNKTMEPVMKHRDGCTTKLSMPMQPAGLQDLEGMCRKHGIGVSYLPDAKRLKATAGTILQKCLREVEIFRNKMNRNLCVFKLGLTSNPVVRFQSYQEANYTHMTLLHVSEVPGGSSDAWSILDFLPHDPTWVSKWKIWRWVPSRFRNGTIPLCLYCGCPCW